MSANKKREGGVDVEALRCTALHQAIVFRGGACDTAEIVKTARAFEAFLLGQVEDAPGRE